MIRFLLLTIFLLLVMPIQAIYDPLIVPNNKYGMHIADLSDVADVAPLVNSSGGDWGYVTLVASDHDRDIHRWQRIFDQMRRLHLIPLVRIATHVEKDYWVKPNPVDFDSIVSFFNSLNWPTQNRYIILYNEPNHAKEWGNTIDPEGYAKTIVAFSIKFKAASEDFFILPAGLDVSAATDALSLSADLYMDRMALAEPGVFDHIDGWTSHSYPNPAFSGSPHALGRGTLRSYEWELAYLQKFGFTRSAPIFITETGWVKGALTSEQIGINLLQAASGAWSDPRIVAITPFVFNYQAPPFETFSWKKLSKDGGYFPQYEYYKNIQKTMGQPKQREQYALSDTLLPLALVTESSYTLHTQITNNGQGILSPGAYTLELSDDNAGFLLIADPIPTLEPGEKGEITIHVQTPPQEGIFSLTLNLAHFGQKIALQTQEMRLVSPPNLTVKSPLGWRRQSDSSDVTVLVYDDKTLLHKYTGLSLKNGTVHIQGLSSIIPGQPYRVVVLAPYYLPRQTIQAMQAEDTTVYTKRLLPLDFNQDGTFTIKDLFSMIALKPHFILSLFVGN